MATSTPTLINLPPPPSDPVTPSDMGPGTPNSGTTSLSALSTTAIKDGHQGQPHPYARHAHHSSSTSMASTNTLEAERADRISRLAGLERVATARGSGASGQQPQGPTSAAVAAGHVSGYFDNYPALRERSTVGSASATGSVGGRTTWASGSDAFDADKMSEGPDDGTSSVGNLSDEGDTRSLVGFGEGASSTISGPTSSHPGLHRLSSGGGRPAPLGSPTMTTTSRGNHHQQLQQQQYQQYQPYHPSAPSTTAQSLSTIENTALPPSPSPAGSTTPEPTTAAETAAAVDARMVDGMTYDPDVVDTTARTPRLVTPYDRSPTSGVSQQAEM
ncbi:hypothetical protein ASPZODRAFT_930313 [Penicilliopsis zonata CBS 506.65]|uniref:Uncharacterized protein n=1 Tax=Penicilliopsis zonata CBS 506.65 TaxID=1073090 RepID=A0A1L9S8B5_9EURO|nr:hypothetical protein ASPZODRAFT_930313 [Penicilliopsis zonata CBS 506.65]OJJ43390.1 hypothetical protein ASPZODRAFT_930313 [Penicilliopsis zonata CBS 506.65]